MVGPPPPSGPIQLSPRARIRAVVVFPTPRTPVRMNACAMRPVANAFDRVRTIASCPISSAKVEGRYLRARTRYAAAESFMRGPVEAGDRTDDPDRNLFPPLPFRTHRARESLRLLPSGPDRVGEGPVHRRAPAPTIPGQSEGCDSNGRCASLAA